VAARLVGTVKNSSDRGSCGSCKHEPEHGGTNERMNERTNERALGSAARTNPGEKERTPFAGEFRRAWRETRTFEVSRIRMRVCESCCANCRVAGAEKLASICGGRFR